MLAGLIVCGALLFAGHELRSGTTEALAAYIGWFLAVYSTLAYAVSGTICLLRPSKGFWRTLYPANFGLALVAIALFGLHSQRVIPTLLAIALLGVFAGVILYKSGVLSLRAVPLVLLISLCVCFLPSVAARWMFVFVFFAAVLLACFTLTRLREGVR